LRFGVYVTTYSDNYWGQEDDGIRIGAVTAGMGTGDNLHTIERNEQGEVTDIARQHQDAIGRFNAERIGPHSPATVRLDSVTATPTGTPGVANVRYTFRIEPLPADRVEAALARWARGDMFGEADLIGII
jgi:hypothetical protein